MFRRSGRRGTKRELVEQESPMYISVGAIILILVIVAIVLVMRGRRV